MGKIGQKTRTKLGLIEAKPDSLEGLPQELQGELIGLLKQPDGKVMFVRLEYKNGELVKVIEKKGPDQVHFMKQHLVVYAHKAVHGDI